MKSFDPSQYGEPGTVLDVEAPRWRRRSDIVLPDRQENEWQRLGAVLSRVVTRLPEPESLP